MVYDFIKNVESCHIELPPLLFYSHIPTMALSLLLGFFVFFKSRKLIGKLLLAIAVVFSLWLAMDLIAWISVSSSMLMFVWSFFGLLYVALFTLCFYFLYVYIKEKDVDVIYKIIIIILTLPAIFFVPTSYNVKSFDYSTCVILPEKYYSNYYHLFGLLMFLLMIFFSINNYRKAELEKKKRVVLISIGLFLFLFSFFITEYLAEQMMNWGWVTNFSFEHYGLFGMPIFMGFIAYLIVRYKAFDIKLIGSQALVIALIALVGSQFFFAQNLTSNILTGITLVLVGGIGIALIRSVKMEVERKEQLQHMSDKLAEANDQLRKLDNAKSEFISIASHQLRTPLTAIKGFISLLTEGTYGKISQTQSEVLNKVYISNERLINLVEDLLNISRIESGRMEFRFGNCQLTDLCKELVDTFVFKAKEANLYLDYKAPEYPLPEVFVDSSKVREVLSNLIDNAIKYTPKGGVSLRLERIFMQDSKIENVSKKGSIRITVADTGIGVPAEEVPYLFSKFSRGKDVGRLNVSGTGLGLYVGKSMIEANGGKVWVESDGANLGSRFIIELPVEQTQENLTRWG